LPKIVKLVNEAYTGLTNSFPFTFLVAEQGGIASRT